jgi:small neutral amino acid transporter SnatA (MarC family)
MDVLQVVGAFWLSTWLMIMFRTFGIINRLVDTYEIALVQKFKGLHLIILSVFFFFTAPALWQIVVSDSKRKAFIISYVNALRNKT